MQCNSGQCKCEGLSLMGSDNMHLIILAIIAIFLILKLRSILGTRDGFEYKKNINVDKKIEKIEYENDADIKDYVDVNSSAGKALKEMKQADSKFSIDEFLSGAGKAYEIILMDFEAGNYNNLKAFLSNNVYKSFKSAIIEREEKGLKIDAQFIGLREVKLSGASYNKKDNIGEIIVTFKADLIYIVKDKNDRLIEGDDSSIKSQKDKWTFAREMSGNDPNWKLIETDG